MAKPSRSTAIGQAAPHGAAPPERTGRLNATLAVFIDPVSIRHPNVPAALGPDGTSRDQRATSDLAVGQ
jgi:hypothetical protein